MKSVKSFHTSAALNSNSNGVGMGDKRRSLQSLKNAPRPSLQQSSDDVVSPKASKALTSPTPQKLPSLVSLPNIKKPMVQPEPSNHPAPVASVPSKKKLDPVDLKKGAKKRKKHKSKHTSNNNNDSDDENDGNNRHGKSNNQDENSNATVVKKQAPKKSRKAEEKAILKDQVQLALKAVRGVFDSPKGQNILVLESRVHRATKTDATIKVKVKRKNADDSLGISFTIPARVMALGWESGQHLVVTDVTPKPNVKSNLEVGDIVVAVDGEECHNIAELKQCVAGKKKMAFTVIRDDDKVEPEELAATQERIEKSLKTAVKAKVKAALKSNRKTKQQDL